MYTEHLLLSKKGLLNTLTHIHLFRAMQLYACTSKSYEHDEVSMFKSYCICSCFMSGDNPDHYDIHLSISYEVLNIGMLLMKVN